MSLVPGGAAAGSRRVCTFMPGKYIGVHRRALSGNQLVSSQNKMLREDPLYALWHLAACK